MTAKEYYAIIWTAIVFVLIAGYTIWLSDRDARLMRASQAYEDCVMENFSTTPTKWRHEHGEYPICNSNQ